MSTDQSSTPGTDSATSDPTAPDPQHRSTTVSPGLEVYAADVDPAAVACARRNLPPDRVHESDLYAALPERLRGRVTVVVANAPYVPTEAIATMPPEARDHEHRVALDGGADGLDVQHRVIADAPAWLADGGRVLVESSERQAPVSAALMSAAGLDAVIDGQAVVGTRPTVIP
jgi:release factor glutamine methyltransferase